MICQQCKSELYAAYDYQCQRCKPNTIDPERLALVCAALTGLAAAGPKASGDTTEEQLRSAIALCAVELADVTLAELRKPKEPGP